MCAEVLRHLIYINTSTTDHLVSHYEGVAAEEDLPLDMDQPVGVALAAAEKTMTSKPINRM